MSEEKSLMPIDSIFSEEQQKIFTTLDATSFEGKKAILKALSNADYTFDDLEGQSFSVENVLVHEVEIETDEGERVKQLRTVLISSDGLTASFVSNGMINGLKNLFFLIGMPPWKPPVKIKIKQQKTRRGFRTYNLELID